MKRFFKNIFAIALTLLMVGGFAGVVQAETLSDNYCVTTNCDLVTNSDIGKLSDQASKIADKYDVNVAVYITNNITDGDIVDYADVQYEDWFGINTDGLILVIYDNGMNDNSREYWISTSGSCIYTFSDERIDNMGQDMMSALKSENYAKASEIFLDDVEFALENPNTSYSNEAAYKSANRSANIKKSLIALAIAFVITLVVLVALANQLKSVGFAHSAKNYERPGSKKITTSRDTFLYHTISKTPKPKNNSSSTHTSSGGGSHGGGGGHF